MMRLHPVRRARYGTADIGLPNQPIERLALLDLRPETVGSIFGIDAQFETAIASHQIVDPALGQDFLHDLGRHGVTPNDIAHRQLVAMVPGCDNLMMRELQQARAGIEARHELGWRQAVEQAYCLG